MNDVTPEARVDDNGETILECKKCNWKGHPKDYHQAKHGLIKLTCREQQWEKL